MVNALVSTESGGENVTDAFMDSGECRDRNSWHIMDVNVRFNKFSLVSLILNVL